MRNWVFAAALWATSVAGAASTVPDPVTLAEWDRTLVRAELVLRAGLGLPPRSGAVPREDARPIGRRDVAEGLDRLFAVAKSELTFTPRHRSVDLAPLRAEANAVHRGRLETLLRWGLMAPVGPVTLGERDRFSMREIGDALGFFFTRIAELTYTPTGRFTPYLMGDEPGEAPPEGNDRSR